MKFEDIEIGMFYSSPNSETIYKVIDKGKDWICVLSYSCEYHICAPCLIKSDNKALDIWEQEDDSIECVFKNLSFYDTYSLWNDN